MVRDTPLEQLLDMLIDYRGKTPPKTESGVPLITAKVIKGGRIIESRAEFIAEDFYDEWMTRGLPKQWDVLITTEAPLGEVAILRTKERVALAQRVILLRGNPKLLDQRYLSFVLQSPIMQARLNARSSGATVAGIKQSELRQVAVPTFDLLTQRRIAAILSSYDDLFENNNRRITILEDLASRIYVEWFVNYRFPGHESVPFTETQLGRIPYGWSVVSADDAIDINPKVKVPKVGVKPFVPMGCLSEINMLISDIEAREGNSGSKFQNGDTLFARITPCLENGKTAFVQFLPSPESVGFGSTEFIVLRSRNLTPEYVYMLARSDTFRNNAIKSMGGADGRQRVKEGCFASYLFAHPDAATLEKFTNIIRPMFRMIHILACKNLNLRTTRDLLLPRLISGELDVSTLPLPEDMTA